MGHNTRGTALYADNSGSGTGGFEVAFSSTGGFSGNAAGVGDVFRIHTQNGVSQIEKVEDGDAAKATQIDLDPFWLQTADDTGVMAAGASLAAVPIIDNGFKYKISFVDNSGDLPDLVCNTGNLRSVYRMAQAAYVSRDEPDRVYFVDTAQGSAQPAYSPVKQAELTHPSAITAGDTIYVGEQRCDVISSDSDLASGSIVTTLRRLLYAHRHYL